MRHRRGNESNTHWRSALQPDGCSQPKSGSAVFRDLGRDDLADKLWQALVDISGKSLQSSKLWPRVNSDVFTKNWERAHDQFIVPYFQGRQQLWEAQATGEAGGLHIG